MRGPRRRANCRRSPPRADLRFRRRMSASRVAARRRRNRRRNNPMRPAFLVVASRRRRADGRQHRIAVAGPIPLSRATAAFGSTPHKPFAAQMTTAAPQARKDSPPAPPSLLLVDDDPLILDSLGGFFEDEFAVVCAANRQEAAAALLQMSAAPDFAAVDLGLPPAPHRPDEGLAVIREIQGRRAEVRDCRRFRPRSNPKRHARPRFGRDRFCRQAVRAGRVARRFVARARSRPRRRRRIGLGRRIAADAKTARANPPNRAFAFFGFDRRRNRRRQRSRRPRLAQCLAPRRAFRRRSLRGDPAASRRADPFSAARAALSPARCRPPDILATPPEGLCFWTKSAICPESIQAKLLRALESGEYRRVGESRVREASARIVAASNRPLAAAVRRGEFRGDLYHRIGVFTLRAPSLREIGDDRFLLFDHYRKRVASELCAEPVDLAADAREVWRGYRFAGNVRELKNIVARLTVKRPGETVSAATLIEEIDPPTRGSMRRRRTARRRGALSSNPKSKTTTLIWRPLGGGWNRSLRARRRGAKAAMSRARRGFWGWTRRACGRRRSATNEFVYRAFSLARGAVSHHAHDRFFLSRRAARRDTRCAVVFGSSGEGIMLVTGEVGSGKDDAVARAVGKSARQYRVGLHSQPQFVRARDFV